MKKIYFTKYFSNCENKMRIMRRKTYEINKIQEIEIKNKLQTNIKMSFNYYLNTHFNSLV